MSSTSCTTTGLRVGDNEASRTPIGRPIADTPASLAAASPARLTREASSDSINSGMSVGSQLPAPVAPRVDQKNLVTGEDSRSKPGDTAKASLFACADNDGPRQSAGQYKGSKFETQPPFVRTANAEETGS